MNEKDGHEKAGKGPGAAYSSAFLQRKEINIPFWSFEKAGPRIKVYFSTRIGGVSKPPYDTLNLSFDVGDEPGCVHKNRQLWGRALGVKAYIITSPRQKHSAEVAVLDHDIDIGAGAKMIGANPFDPCDAMITALKSAPIQLHFADCVPVVLSAQVGESPLIGVVHAGRKSMMAGVIGNAAARMASLGADPSLVTAAIGPAIGRCCYEVDGVVAAEFSERLGSAFIANGKLDLKAAAVGELVKAGLDRENVYDVDICTCCDEDFFSYRRDGPDTGRQAAIAWIE
jgi:YfiH family protein